MEALKVECTAAEESFQKDRCHSVVGVVSRSPSKPLQDENQWGRRMSWQHKDKEP